MSNTNKQRTILSIAPSTPGFGFAFIQEPANLINWGIKWIGTEKKNKKALRAVKKMIQRLGPDVIVLHQASESGSRRSKRIQELTQQLKLLAKHHGIPVYSVTQKKLQEYFFGGDEGTKYTRAKLLAERFPKELGHLMPPKRQAWMSENPWMATFDAVALALTLMYLGTKSGSPQKLKNGLK